MDPGTLEFVRRALALKDEPRRGWLRAGVARPESVADHTWGVALLALVAAQTRPDLDRARLLELAITHDLAEAVVGDLVPGEYAHKGEKVARERRGLEDLVDTLPVGLRGLLLHRFEELVSGDSAEARLVHDLDKLEMAFQAARYREKGLGHEAVSPFLCSAQDAVKDPKIRDAVDRLSVP